MRAFDPEQLPAYINDLDTALETLLGPSPSINGVGVGLELSDSLDQAMVELLRGSREGQRPLELEHVEVRGIIEGSGIKLSKYSRMLLDRERKARMQPKVKRGKRKMGRKKYRHWQRLRIKRERKKAGEFKRWSENLEKRGISVRISKSDWDDWVGPLTWQEPSVEIRLYDTKKPDVTLWDFYVKAPDGRILYDGMEEKLRALGCIL